MEEKKEEHIASMETLANKAAADFMSRPRYYEDLGQAHDNLMRCKDCNKLVTYAVIAKLGMCDGCGNKRFSEITLLKQEEMDDIQSGKIDFPHRDKFLAEFPKGIEA